MKRGRRHKGDDAPPYSWQSIIDYIEAHPETAWPLAREEIIEQTSDGTASGTSRRELLWYWTAVLTIAVLRILITYARSSSDRISRRRPIREPDKDVFVGFGGGAERYLLAGYGEPSTVLYLHTNRLASFAQLGRPRVLECIIEVWRAVKETARVSNRLPVIIRRWSELKRQATRATSVAWVRAVTSRYEVGSTRITVASLDEITFALASRYPYHVRFTQHGLLKRSVALPKLGEIVALTEDEARYFRARLSNVRIRVADVPDVSALLPSHSLLLCCGYEPERELSDAAGFVQLARNFGLVPVIRFHPSYPVDRLSGPFRECGMITSERKIEEEFVRSRPLVVVSWTSTALALALRCGLVPLSLAPQNSELFDWMIYPMRDRALFWQRDRSLVIDLFNNPDLRESIVARLRLSESPPTTGALTSAEEL